MQNRGQVGPVFKYLMAIIVGTMFLLFFINFGMTYMKQQKSVESYMITTGFDDVLSALGSSEDASNTYNFGLKTTIDFKVPKKGSEYIELKSGGNLPLKSYKAIFAPSKITGTKVEVLTKRWYFPYPVDNLFYLTATGYKYFIVYDDETESLAKDLAGADATDVTAAIPSKFGAEAVDAAKAKGLKSSLANVKATFILFEEDAELESALRKLPNAKVRVIKMDKDDPDYGEIMFEDGQEYPYFGKPMMIGAIFAEDSAMYEHALSVALNKVGVVTKIYLGKLEYLSNTPQLLTCTQYGLMKMNLEALYSQVRSEDTSVPKYKSLVEGIDNNNELLGGDCPEIF